jgi:tetratricopeptide (TPR) repeat protein
MTTIAEALTQARQYHELGLLQPAEQLYRAILDTDPNQVEVLHLAGLVAAQSGRAADAIVHFRQALRLRPDFAEALFDLSNLLAQHGKLDEACAGYRVVIRLRPDYAGTYVNLAEVLQRVGRLAEAVAACRDALRIAPDCAPAHNNLGNSLRGMGRLAEAVAAFRDAIRFKPDYAEAHNNLGIVLYDLGRPAEATVCYQQALQLKPDYAQAHNNLGLAWQGLGRLDEAALCYQQAIRLSPESAIAYLNLANLMHHAGRLTESADFYRQAIRMKPDFAEAHGNLAVVLLHLRQVPAAEIHAREAIRLTPECAEAHNNLGTILHDRGEAAEAEACCREAIRLMPACFAAHHTLAAILHTRGRRSEAMVCLDESVRHKPDHAESHLYRAMGWLLEGDFERGWREYEWRQRCRNFAIPALTVEVPVWDGTAMPGKTLLIRAEQGLGDAVEFVRYTRQVKERVARVVVECPRELARLFATCPDIDEIAVRGQPSPACDAQVFMLSLPGLAGTTLSNIPAEVPYLHADPALVERWRGELSQHAKFKVGIVWQGKSSDSHDRWRAIPLARFAPLAQIEGVQLFSLQKGGGVEQLEAADAPKGIIDLGPRLDVTSGPFMDTAAVMRNMDLVITSDTAAAHLAGALGVPVWIVLQLVPHWPWLMHREDSPWYPTARLFRQREFGNWEDVFERIASELNGRIEPQRHGDTEKRQ